MKVMMMRKADSETEKGALPSDTMLKAMGDYNEQLINAGVMVSGDGLKPSSAGVRIAFSNGEPKVIDGPFSETKELLAGYTVLEVESMQEAISWAKQWPSMDSDGNVTLELRPYYGLEDFVQGEGIAQHIHNDQKMSRQPDNISMYLTFDGRCREAMQFYAEVLGGDVVAMIAHKDTPIAAEMSADWQDKIIHAQVKVAGYILMAADAPPEHYQKPVGAPVQLGFNSVEAGRQAYEKLSQGGTISMAFAETFWAKGFAMFTDRYGIDWMINAGNPDSADCA